MKNTIWIYDEDHRKLLRVARDRLEFPEYAPENMAQFHATKKRWYYVYYGDTADECCDRANELAANRIAELEREIAKLRTEMVTP